MKPQHIDHPIIFSGPMVRLLLRADHPKTMTRREAWRTSRKPPHRHRPSPWQRVVPGDRLWVRETWQQVPGRVFYAADDPPNIWRWRSPIHMMRRQSRITLLVTDTRIERLHDINTADIRREGVDSGDRDLFADLWRQINGDRSWTKNPDVVVIAFTVHVVNIDQMRKAA